MAALVNFKADVAKGGQAQDMQVSFALLGLDPDTPAGLSKVTRIEEPSVTCC